LITCMVIRAIHLEVVSGISTKHVHDAFQCFTSTRGYPVFVHTDNGTSFVKAARDIRHLHRAVADAAGSGRFVPTIKWIFSTPLAPWQGGYFERLVGMVKTHLPLLAVDKRMSDADFRVTVKSAEAIINSRPLGVLSDGVMLTPGHFLVGKPLIAWPDIAVLPDEPETTLEQRIAFRNHSLTQLYGAWKRSYLTHLRHRFQQPTKTVELKVGDLMLIHDRDASRKQWDVGKIVELFPGVDGVVRNVLLDVNGRRKERAVRLLSRLQSIDATLADVETFGSERLNLDATSDPETDAPPVLHHHQSDAVDSPMFGTPDAHDGLNQPPLLDSMQLLVLLSDAL
jgi:hypothetical protein